MNRKILFSIAGVLFLIGAVIGYNYYQKIYGVSVTQSGYLYIKSNDSKNSLFKELPSFVENIDVPTM